MIHKDRNWWRKINEAQRQLYRQLYKKSCYHFVQEFWNEADPQPFTDGVVVQIFCEMFQFFTRYWLPFYKELNDPELERKIEEYRRNGYKIIDVRKENKKNVSIAIPPRHSKTMCWSVCSPTWGEINNPLKTATFSHTSGLAIDINKKRQKIMNSEKFKFFFPEIVLETNTSQVLKTSNSGELFAIARESATGFGADVLVCDDIVNAGQARRDAAEMDAAFAFMQDTLPSRANDITKYVILNVAQRLAPNDIEGRIKELPSMASQYSFITLPAQFDEDTLVVCPITGTLIEFKKGSFLWPERFGDYSGLRAQVGETVWQSQYLQKPQYADTNVVKEQMIKVKSVNEVPSIEMADMVYASHDFPVKATETSDFLGSIVAYKVGANLYIKRALEEKKAFVESINYVKALDSAYPGIVQIIEDKANGAPILQALQDVVPGMQAYQPGTNDKKTRLEMATPFMVSGNVIFVADEWDENTGKYILAPDLANLKKELLAFPFLQHDDVVDAFSQVVNFVFMDKKFAVYGRSFHSELNVVKAAPSSATWSNVFFNKEGDNWKALDIAVEFGAENKLYVLRETQFKATIDDGISKLKEFSNGSTVLIDCSAGEGLYGYFQDGVSIESYTADDFDKSVTDLSLAFSTRKILIIENCKMVKADIENFKFEKSKDENVRKYRTQKDGFVACIRSAMNYYGGII